MNFTCLQMAQRLAKQGEFTFMSQPTKIDFG